MAEDNKIIAELLVSGKDKFVSDLKSANKATDDTTTAVQKMEKAIQSATDPKDIQRLSKELEAVKIASEAGATAFESSKAKLRAYKEEATGLATVLATLKNEGKQGTQTFKDIERQFEATKKKAGALSDQIEDVNREIKALGSDTRGIDNVVRGATLMANSFQLATGVQALLGKENKALTEGLLKLNSIMAVTQSIQQIGNELTREDSIVKQAATKATALYTLVVGESTGALKFFRLALAATGIGLAIIGIVALYQNWDKLKEAIIGTTQTLETFRAKQEQVSQQRKSTIDSLKKELEYQILIGNETEKTAKAKIVSEYSKQLQDANKELLKQVGILKQLEKSGANDTVAGIKVGSDVNQKRIEQQTQVVREQTQTVKDLTSELLKSAKVEADKTQVLKDTSKEIKTIKDNIDELDSVGINYGINSEKYLKDQIDKFSLLRSTLDITSQEYRDLGELIDLLNKKLSGKQKVEPIDFSGALKGLSPKTIEKKPLTLYEKIFGTAEQNADAKKRVENQVNGALKIVSELNQYGQQISSIAEQAIQIRTANELSLLEEKKNKGLITEKQYEKQSAQIKNEAAQKKRKIDIANATAQVPVAVLSAYIAGLQIGGPAAPIIAGILAGVAGAFGIAQVALIASAPLPKFRDGGSVRKRLGLIRGAKHEHGGVPIEVEGDEFVVKSQATKKYGVKMLDDINNLKFNPILSANKKLKTRGNDMRLYENLATISSYLKQGYKVDANGNKILKEISNKLNNKSVYV